MSEKFKGTRLTYETEHGTTVWESPYSDVTMNDVLWGFYGICIAQTWFPSTVINCMKEFTEKHETDHKNNEQDYGMGNIS